MDRPVHMAFRRQVEDSIDFVLVKDPVNQIGVADVPPGEYIPSVSGLSSVILLDIGEV